MLLEPIVVYPCAGGLFTVHDFASKILIWFLIAAGTFIRGAK